MNTIGRLATLPLRWRSSRGFGVHSPFAFEFITNVLRRDGRYCYYADDAIASLAGHDRGLALLTHRVAAALEPEQVVSVTAPRPWMPLACGCEVLTPDEARPSDNTLVILPGCPDPDAIDVAVKVVVNGGIAVARDDGSLLGALRGSMSRGMTFVNGSGSLVAVGRHHLPLTHYRLHFAL